MTLHTIPELATRTGKSERWLYTIVDELVTAGVAQRMGRNIAVTNIDQATEYLRNRPEARGCGAASKTKLKHMARIGGGEQMNYSERYKIAARAAVAEQLADEDVFSDMLTTLQGVDFDDVEIEEHDLFKNFDFDEHLEGLTEKFAGFELPADRDLTPEEEEIWSEASDSAEQEIDDIERAGRLDVEREFRNKFADMRANIFEMKDNFIKEFKKEAK